MAEDGPDLERQAAHFDLVSRWADDLAHEIKNPLHAMVINLELVKRRAGGDDPAPLVERAEVVEAELERVHALVDSLLRLLRPWPDTTSTPVDTLLAALRPALAARARVRKVGYHEDPCDGIAAVPPGDLTLAMALLADRVLDSIPAGGRLEIRCRTGRDGVRITFAGSGPDPAGEGPAASGSTGPDLAVAERLIRRAGGSVVTEPDRPTPGLTLALTVPAPAMG
ncbi:MAG: histidine kinase dimerization/phospho-acceptor domain-containing protein [Gemmatimonadota bacterium]